MTRPTAKNQLIRDRLEQDMKKYLESGGVVTRLPSCMLSEQVKGELTSSVFMKRKEKKRE